MLQSALRSAELAEETGLRPRPDHPLRQGQRACATSSTSTGCSRPAATTRSTSGLTEAGMGDEGHRRLDGRSRDPAQRGHRRHDPRLAHPGARRRRASEEVEVAQQVLQSMGLRSFLPQVSACPGCGRTTSTFFQEMAQQIQALSQGPDAGLARDASGRRGPAGRGDGLRRQRPRRIASTPTSASRLPGTFEEPVAPVFIDGKLDRTLRGDGIVAEFIGILEGYVDRGTLRRSPASDGRTGPAANQGRVIRPIADRG